MTHIANVWEETAVAAPRTAPLDASARADVLVIGAGYLGLSAGLHLAENGADVMILEAEHPGFGASGRNGGQVIPGLKHSPDEVEAALGAERGERVWRLAAASADAVLALVGKYGLNTNARRVAWVQGACSERAALAARVRVEQWATRGAGVDYADAAETERLTGTRAYLGALVDRRAVRIQPLSYARELARVAMSRGARIHGGTRIVAMTRDGSNWRCATSAGVEVKAPKVLVCTNAYTDTLLPDVPRSFVTTHSLQVATAPLPSALRATILPDGALFSETRRILRYGRLDDAGRLLVGSRGPYREPGPLSDWKHVERDLLQLFPQVEGVPITHRWGGRVSVHRDYWPRLHAPASGVLVAAGCQGRGIGWQTAMGIELARRALDDAYDPALPITDIRALPFAPFKRLGVTLVVAGYRLLDRLGIP